MAQTRTERASRPAPEADPTELLTQAQRDYRATVVTVFCAALLSAALLWVAPWVGRV